MAGLAVAAAPVVHRKRGVVRTHAVLTTGADGTLSDIVIGVGFGRLVGVLSKGPNAPTITVKDTKTGATLLTHRPNITVFGNTTTGDEAGGASPDLFTTGAAHGLVELQPIVFVTQTGSTLPAVGTVYYVAETTGFSATTFCLAASLADAAAGGEQVIVELDGDISASTWYSSDQTVSASFVRPTDVVTTVAGADISAATTAPNVNRDIYVAGKVSVSAAGGLPSTDCTLGLIVDEVGLGDLALTV